MLEVASPKVETLFRSENYGRYRVEPLEPGFATTLGNALRRVLLAALPGAAVTSIRINGIYHDFSEIPNVKEDTIDLLLNIKQLRLRCHSDHPVQLLLEASGAGRVCAADIICPPEVEIINPELYLLTLDSSDAKLSMELTVEKGKGYVPADHREGLPIGVLPVDAIYTPIVKANYKAERTRVGQATDYDRLELEVWTDGTIGSDEAVAQAAQVLVDHFTLLTGVGGKAVVREKKERELGPAIPPDIREAPIEELGLSVRAYNCLKRAGLAKMGQVLEMTADDFIRVRNFGQKSLREVQEKLADKGWLQHSRLAEPEEHEGELPAAEEAVGETPLEEEEKAHEEIELEEEAAYEEEEGEEHYDDEEDRGGRKRRR